MKKRNKKLGATDDKFRALTSLNHNEYEFLLPIFDALVTERLKYYTLKGKRRARKSFKEVKNSSLAGSPRKLDFILTYLKGNPNQAYHGCLFELCQSKVSEWISFLLPLLQEALMKMKLLPESLSTLTVPVSLQTDYLIVDVTERCIPRRKCQQAQEVEYSGKKKQHTIKNLAVTDSNRNIIYISETYEGSVHDKSILDEIDINSQGLNILFDLGFQGADKDYDCAILPHKKLKGKELTDFQKSVNTAISKERVQIENVFASVKRLKILRNKVRLRCSQIRHKIILIGAGLHNLRNAFRNPLINNS